jgi:hypothetical protein
MDKSIEYPVKLRDMSAIIKQHIYRKMYRRKWKNRRAKFLVLHEKTKQLLRRACICLRELNKLKEDFN